MKLLSNKRAGSRGVLLIECIVYMAVFTVLLGIATMAFFHCWDASKDFGRDVDAVERSVQAGERWRADIRGATGPVEKTAVNGGEMVRIPQARGEVVYAFAGSEIRRRADHRETVVLSHIKLSRMQPEARSFGEIWRWELELETKHAKRPLRPLFTFETVSPARNIP
jgi:Tfp pilus assembly protein FimT